MSPDAYGAQKRREALAAAAALGAEVRFGPFRDGEVPNDEGARRYVAGVIRDVRPTIVITHWKHSIHRDHAATSAVVQDAVLLASLDGVAVDGAPYRGVRGVWYAENWEDREGFSPYVYVAVRDSTALARWRDAVTKYEFARGGVAPFPYLDYYQALAVVRGAEAHAGRAEAFDVDEIGKRRVLDSLP
jgi:LmbE family N-acetylglucosaminyl deacetylase